MKKKEITRRLKKLENTIAEISCNEKETLDDDWPQCLDRYFYHSNGVVMQKNFVKGYEQDEKNKAEGNCYRAEEEAQAALKGKQWPKTDDIVWYIDNEKSLERAFRFEERRKSHMSMHAHGAVYKTQEEAKKALRDQATRVRILNRIRELSGVALIGDIYECWMITFDKSGNAYVCQAIVSYVSPEKRLINKDAANSLAREFTSEELKTVYA